MGQLKEQLIKHIDEAHAMEQNVLRMLDGMISTTDDPEILDALEHHKMQTQGHADRMAQRLEAHDAAPSTVKQLGGVIGALAKLRGWRHAADLQRPRRGDCHVVHAALPRSHSIRVRESCDA